MDYDSADTLRSVYRRDGEEVSYLFQLNDKYIWYYYKLGKCKNNKLALSLTRYYHTTGNTPIEVLSDNDYAIDISRVRVPEQITKEEYDKLVKTQEPTMENALETLTKITPAAMTKIYKDVLQEIRNNTTNS